MQLAYALAAGTLSASKAFTESFNSNFGLGFTRGKVNDSYGLSNVSSKTPVSSNDGKSGNDSTLESGNSVSRTHSYPSDSFPKSQIEYSDPMVTPMPPSDSRGSLHMKLRPDVEANTLTHVSADTGAEQWRDQSINSSNNDGNDMVIMRETGYKIQRDQPPFWSTTNYYEGHM